MSRSKFEEWAMKNGFDIDLWNGDFESLLTESAQEGWLAGRESMREDSAKVCGDMKADASPDQCAEAILRIEL